MAKKKIIEDEIVPANEENAIKKRGIESMIISLRGTYVMLDRDLAYLYGVTTSR